MGGLFRIIFPQPRINTPPPPAAPAGEDPSAKQAREDARRAALRTRRRRALNPTGVLGDRSDARVARRTLLGARRPGARRAGVQRLGG